MSKAWDQMTQQDLEEFIHRKLYDGINRKIDFADIFEKLNANNQIIENADRTIAELQKNVDFFKCAEKELQRRLTKQKFMAHPRTFWDVAIQVDIPRNEAATSNNKQSRLNKKRSFDVGDVASAPPQAPKYKIIKLDYPREVQKSAVQMIQDDLQQLVEQNNVEAFTQKSHLAKVVKIFQQQEELVQINDNKMQELEIVLHNLGRSVPELFIQIVAPNAQCEMPLEITRNCAVQVDISNEKVQVLTKNVTNYKQVPQVKSKRSAINGTSPTNRTLLNTVATGVKSTTSNTQSKSCHSKQPIGVQGQLSTQSSGIMSAKPKTDEDETSSLFEHFQRPQSHQYD